MRCRDIMRSPVRTISEDDTVEIAAKIMREANIGFLPVHDFSAHFVGTLTDRDIALRIVAEGLPTGTKVGLVMTREAIACRPDDPIQDAERMMATHRKSRIVCTTGSGYIEGVISIGDLATDDAPASVGRLLREIATRDVRH